jgi:hypothetical protein
LVLGAGPCLSARHDPPAAAGRELAQEIHVLVVDRLDFVRAKLADTPATPTATLSVPAFATWPTATRPIPAAALVPVPGTFFDNPSLAVPIIRHGSFLP